MYINNNNGELELASAWVYCANGENYLVSVLEMKRINQGFFSLGSWLRMCFDSQVLFRGVHH